MPYTQLSEWKRRQLSNAPSLLDKIILSLLTLILLSGVVMYASRVDHAIRVMNNL